MTKSDVLGQANRWLSHLISYVPGKPIDDVARELGLASHQIIKLASNENPLGASPRALEAMREALATVHFYPDGGGFHLRQAIAAHFDLPITNVMLGNGSNEIIEFLGHAFLRPGDNVLTSEHAFAIYHLMAELFGAAAVEVPDPGFVADVQGMVDSLTPATKIVYLANPNNPTGTRVTNEQLKWLVHAVPERVVLAIDEAYYEFLEDAPDTISWMQSKPNVILLRTFSKIQGLAGLRIGYGLANAELIALLQKTRQPFNANSIAQAGAIAGLRDAEHIQRTREMTFSGRKVLEQAFQKRGLEYVPSAANFVLVRVGDGDAVFKALLRRGTIVRAMMEYHLPEYIRVSVGTPEQNQRFLADLDAVLTPES